MLCCHTKKGAVEDQILIRAFSLPLTCRIAYVLTCGACPIRLILPRAERHFSGPCMPCIISHHAVQARQPLALAQGSTSFDASGLCSAVGWAGKVCQHQQRPTITSTADRNGCQSTTLTPLVCEAQPQNLPLGSKSLTDMFQLYYEVCKKPLVKRLVRSFPRLPADLENSSAVLFSESALWESGFTAHPY